MIYTALGDIHVGLGQVQPGLAGLPGHAGGDDNDVGIRRIGIIAAAHNGGRAEGGRLVNVQCLAEGLLLVDVDQNDLGGNALHHQVVGDGCANAACTDHSNFTHNNDLLFRVPPGGVWVVTF